MTQETLQELSPNAKSSRTSRPWIEVLLSSGVLAAVISILPQYIESFIKKIPPDTLSMAREQERLFVENFDCVKEQKPLLTQPSKQMAVNLWVCPDGDTLVELQDKVTGQQLRRWVSAETFANSSATLHQLLIPSAVALTLPENSNLQTPRAIVAQAPTVLCQELRDGKLFRKLRYEDGRCELEVTNTSTGEVTRTASTCSASC
jgi:hypothetical protein